MVVRFIRTKTMKTTKSSLRGPLAVFLAILVVPTSPKVNATLLRDDGNKKNSVNLGRHFNAVGHFGKCTATYIGDDKAITAAHCIKGGAVGNSFIIGPSLGNPDYERTIIDAKRHPTYKGRNSAYDIGLLTLDESIPIQGMTLSGRRRIGKSGVIVGFGATGDGISRKSQSGRGVKRAVKNKIDVLVPNDFKPHKDDRGAIYIDFDSPNGDTNSGSSGNIVAAESIVVECMNEKPRPSLCFVTGIGKS
ncbi:MAG: hypothetical protein ACI8UO_006822, partial [Verrucomicrobiales bacterium]